MSFMEKQVTEKQTWLQADTRHEGIVSLPADMFSKEFFAEQYNIDVENIEEVEGYGARMSAPGYMDCTEWAVFDTAEEAKSYLSEMYGDDDEEEAE